EQPVPEGVTAPSETPSPEALPVVPSETPTPDGEATPDIIDPVLDEAEAISNNMPSWMQSLTAQMEPMADIIWILYLAADIFLVVMATTLLLAFWGGRFSLSWRFIAAAGFCFYIADMWYYYALDNIENYESGGLPEVFWIFSGVLFCIGAALEYSLSTRSRRGRRRSSV
ncbi:MAG: hypothetical protein AAFR31_04835, partial [Cyanobacteria bacterium J06627_8]